MKREAGLLLIALGAAVLPAPTHAQGSTGEFRLTAVAGAALRPSDAHPPVEADGPPGGGILAGLSGSFSFVHGKLSAGPEAMLLWGSDRRMYELGGVARFTLQEGPVRPYLLLGAGHYSWDRRMVLSFDPSAGPVWVRDKTYVTGNAGGGLVIGFRRVALSFELRGHKSLGYDEFFGSRDMLSFGAGGRVSW